MSTTQPVTKRGTFRIVCKVAPRLLIEGEGPTRVTKLLGAEPSRPTPEPVIKKAAPKLTPEERQSKIGELQRLLVGGAKLLYDAGAGSCLDAAKQALASAKGKDLALQIKELAGITVTATALASALVALVGAGR